MNCFPDSPSTVSVVLTTFVSSSLIPSLFDYIFYIIYYHIINISSPSASLFIEMLNIIEQLRTKSSTAVFSFLKAVLANKFPNPGMNTLNEIGSCYYVRLE